MSNWYARNLRTFANIARSLEPGDRAVVFIRPLLAQASAELVDGLVRPENQLERASNLIGVMRYLNTSQSVAPGCRYYTVAATQRVSMNPASRPSVRREPGRNRRVDYIYLSSILVGWNYKLQ